MPSVLLRPNAEISSGNFANESGSGFDVAKINDQNNSTYVYNTSANQSFVVGLDDTSGLAGATFDNFVVIAVMQKHGARGADASFEVDIGDSSSATTFGSISDATFVTTNFSPTTRIATAINFAGGVSASDVDDMRLSITGTDLTQFRLFELSVQINYTAASGYGQNVNTVAAANIGKINTVATANVGKVNTVD
tara:strand:- start:322 stop:903 length:582 start_codon:yes stop_codon:yes gene_type:complete